MSENSVTLKLDLRIICVVLLLIIIGMLGVWRPWQNSAPAVTRKITISGEATVTATPDEFVFYPSFSRSGSDETSMKNDLNTFGTKLVADLKKLGVDEKDITLDSSSYDNYYYYDTADTGAQTITLQVTIKAPNKTLAQKVQDYLAGTDAKGQLTAQAQFSTAKQKDLENTARQQAIADARKKAQQTATNLDAKLGKVLEVSDQQQSYGGGCGSGLACPLSAMSSTSGAADKASLPVTPGTNEVDGNVQVVFALQ